MKRIVIFASGSGSNAENIIKYFNHNSEATVVQVLTNKRDAKVIDRANNLKISALYFNKFAFYESDHILNMLNSIKPDLIVLAGFLWKFPQNILTHFPNKVINIHPALLPKYGGKGMYGMHVHEAVVAHKEQETGITIHYVNEQYDEGAIVFQAKTELKEADSASDVAKKIHLLEQEHFPKVIAALLANKNN